MRDSHLLVFDDGADLAARRCECEQDCCQPDKLANCSSPLKRRANLSRVLTEQSFLGLSLVQEDQATNVDPSFNLSQSSRDERGKESMSKRSMRLHEREDGEGIA